MIIDRKEYVDRLAEKRENGLVKIITGVRRCGKSFLLFKLFKDRLLQEKVPEKNMIFLALDNVENAPLRDPMALFEYLKEKTADKRRYYYIFLDEIQYVGVKILQKDPLVTVTFYDVLNGLMHQGNADIYVTGSNSKMLSKDVATQFRGRVTNFILRRCHLPNIIARRAETRKRRWLPICCTGACRLCFPRNERRKNAHIFRDCLRKHTLRI